MIRNNKKIIFSVLAFVVTTQFYQNCGQLTGFTVLDAGELELGSQGETDLTHPGSEKAVAPSQKLLVYNRTYVASLLREVFTGSNPVPNLEPLLNQWILSRGGQFGQGCDPYGTYSGRDCGSSITNANLAFQTEDNTLRESYRVQFCENVLGMDQAVNAVLEKVANRSVAPTAGAVKQIYGFFYRGDEASDAIAASLMALDTTLAQKGESVMDRWRGVILQVCESSGWQLQ
ncbi:hypothetical protein D3C87_1200860 [compost metagenome]